MGASTPTWRARLAAASAGLMRILARPWAPFLLFLPILYVAAQMRWGWAKLAVFPGHSDYAFYYTVARNLVDGRGLVVDYIWQFLSNPQGIPNPSTDYWLPGASVIIAPFMLAFGKNMLAALMPSMLLGLGVAWPTYLWARDYGRSRFVGFCTATLVLFLPALLQYSLLTDTTIYYVFFITWSLYFMSRGWANPRWFLAAGAFGGIAHTIRQDSLLIVPMLLLAIALWRPSRELAARDGAGDNPMPWPRVLRMKAFWAGAALAVYLAVLSPLLIHNLRALGAPFSPASTKTLWLTTYEDLYSSNRVLTLQTYLAWGWDNIVSLKLGMAETIMQQIWRFVPATIWVLGLTAACLPARKKSRRVKEWARDPARRLPSRPRMGLLALGFMLLIWVFYAFVATYPGTYAVNRSGMIVLPFLMTVIVDALDRNIPWRWVTLLIVGVMALSLYGSAMNMGRGTVRGNNAVGERLYALKPMVEVDAVLHDIPQDEIMIMARDPWEVNLATGHKALEIPNETRDIVYQMALRFGANYIILPGNRWSMDSLVKTRDDPRFEYLGRVPGGDKSVFRIVK